MVNSLQAQLLKTGLVDEKKLKQAQRAKKKAAKTEPAQDTGKAIAQARLEKTERDRQLNKEQQAEAEKKAIKAQIIQLITMNRIDREHGDVAYQFKDGTLIKKIYITQKIQKELINGRLAIAKLANGYELLPASAAEKIAQRDAQVIVVLNQYAPTEVDEDDPYADYQIPDDLMW